MKKISKDQASKRILQIAKAVAQTEAANNSLTPLEIAKVQKTVGLILASTDLDEETLNKIQALQEDNKVNITQNIRQLVQNKSGIAEIKNKQMKNPDIKAYLKENGIVITKPMKVGKFFEVVKNLLINFQQVVNHQDQLIEE